MYVFLTLKDDTGSETLLGDMAFASAEEAYLDVCSAIPGAVAECVREGRDPFRYGYVLTSEEGEVLFEVPFSELIRPPGGRPGRPSARADGPRPRSERLLFEVERARRLRASSRALQARARAAVHDSVALLSVARERASATVRGRAADG